MCRKNVDNKNTASKKTIVTIGCHVDIHKQKSARFLSSISAIILCIYNAC